MAMDFSDEMTLAICARVSKDISECALDSLYRERLRLPDLMRVLCPMKENPRSGETVRISCLSTPKACSYGCCLEPAEPLGSAHWDRFQHYNSRIRSLSLSRLIKLEDDQHNDQQNIDEDVLEVMLSSFPKGRPYLPNLLKLRWDELLLPWVGLACFLIHDGLKELHVSGPEMLLPES